MRITSSAKSYCLIFVTVSALAALTIYLMMYQEHIATILGGCLMVVVFGFIFYVNVPYIFNFMSERATDLLAVYPDASGVGLHIFSGFTVSRWKQGLSPLRTIQYYFLNTDTRRIYYKTLFSHDMASAKGRSGYEGYSSFEEDVLGSEEYRDAIQYFSNKVGWPLELGKASREGEDETYDTVVGGYTFRIVHHIAGSMQIQDTYNVSCFDEADKLQWSKKI